jgi:hypothetical protein
MQHQKSAILTFTNNKPYTMARTTATIQQQILDNINADPTLGPLLTSTSKRAIYNLLTFIMAVAINVLEQLMDIFTANVETTAAAAAPATAAWLQKQVLAFQYSNSNPQIIQYTAGGAPYYPTVDTSLQIISRCSVTTTLANSVLIKVATGSPPAALSSPQLSSLQAYLSPPNGIGIAGVNYTVVSGNPDQLFVQADVFYQGQYSSVIQTNVINAINAYLAAIPFNGQVKLSDLEITIRNVTGVDDVVFVNVSARADGTSFGGGASLVQNQLGVSRYWNTVAGYIISETTANQTLADSLNFIPE